MRTRTLAAIALAVAPLMPSAHTSALTPSAQRRTVIPGSEWTSVERATETTARSAA